MTEEEHNCDNVNCNHNNTKGLCCLHNPDNCKYRQLQKENAELKRRIKADCVDCADYYKNKRLEEENTQLQDKLKNLASVAEVRLANWQKYENENKELKAIIDNDVDKKIYVQLAKKAELADVQKDQLTKAKELIKKFLLWENAWHNKTESKYELLKQAEQFLNSEV